VKQKTIRINQLALHMRGGSNPRAAEVARKIAEQMALRQGVRFPQPLEAALADRLTAPLAGAQRK
jgi:hypothetical protein